MLESVQRLAAGRSNLDLTQAIAVGPYPAPCFDGWQSEKEHRRFLRHLALDRIIRLVDSAGNALNVDGVFKGVIHYKLWYVDERTWLPSTWDRLGNHTLSGAPVAGGAVCLLPAAL